VKPVGERFVTAKSRGRVGRKPLLLRSVVPVSRVVFRISTALVAGEAACVLFWMTLFRPPLRAIRLMLPLDSIRLFSIRTFSARYGVLLVSAYTKMPNDAPFRRVFPRMMALAMSRVL
jgi:hypothetical protein